MVCACVYMYVQCVNVHCKLVRKGENDDEYWNGRDYARNAADTSEVVSKGIEFIGHVFKACFDRSVCGKDGWQQLHVHRITATERGTMNKFMTEITQRVVKQSLALLELH